MFIEKRFFIMGMTAIFVLSTQVKAETITVIETKAPQMTRGQASYEIDVESSRAWVNLHMDNGGMGEDYVEDSTRARVSGLSYDAQSQQIIYVSGGTRTVCANVQFKKFLFMRSTRIKQTQGCVLKTTFSLRNVDDGFERNQVQFVKTTLDLPSL